MCVVGKKIRETMRFLQIVRCKKKFFCDNKGRKDKLKIGKDMKYDE